MKCDVYRCYGDDGRLLYVGASVNVEARLAQHRTSSWWGWMLDRVEVTSFPDEATARAAEREAIATENPRFNIQGRWQTRRAWTAGDYLDFYLASLNGPNNYTGQTQRRLERLRSECLSRYHVDPSVACKEPA